MSIVKATTERSPSGNLHCPQCNAILPPHATFCGSCGERIHLDQESVGTRFIASQGAGRPAVQDESDITTRYRITSLVRRRPYVNLFFASDNQQQRTVAIREIDISSLDDEGRSKASALAQEEYDLLRRQAMPHVMPVIGLQLNQSPLRTVAGPPLLSNIATDRRLHTLQDVLQSGIGLPSQEVALAWISRLCESVESLHSHQIVIGDIDPYAIVLSVDNYESQPTLIVSWLPPQIRQLLPSIVNKPSELTAITGQATSFTAPEVLRGKVEPCSDVYSLGAILYLLLTGTPPDKLALRRQRRLRSPRELNSRISSSVDELVMHALPLDRAARFQSPQVLADAISKCQTSPALKTQAPRVGASPAPTVQHEQDAPALEDYTWPTLWQSPKATPQPEQSALPPVDKEREGAKREAFIDQDAPPSNAMSATWSLGEGGPTRRHTLPSPPLSLDEPEFSLDDFSNGLSGTVSENGTTPRNPRFVDRVTGILPVLPRLSRQITGMLPAIPRSPRPAEPSAGSEVSWLKQVQRIVLGEQQHTTTAAATIETPLRVQPNQNYLIRIYLMGRDEPLPSPAGHWEKKYIQPGGLSARIHGDLVYVEVRSALHQNFTYIVQQTEVTIPALGYLAEIVIPMQPFGPKSDGRRERLHIFFTDEMRRPLYAKPFVVELFVSHLVQPGREGHHTLPIPV